MHIDRREGMTNDDELLVSGGFCDRNLCANVKKKKNGKNVHKQ